MNKNLEEINLQRILGENLRFIGKEIIKIKPWKATGSGAQK